jgi:signal peptidase I
MVAVLLAVSWFGSIQVRADTTEARTPAPRFGSFTVQGEAMVPTLRNGQKVRFERDAYQHRNPSRFDIVVFRAVQAGQPDRLFVKRVIGLPGETVSIHNSSVYINNHKLQERYITAARRALYTYGPARVPAGEYFVLGDNRNNSDDSHLWGMLAKRYIIGRVELTTPTAHPGAVHLPNGPVITRSARRTHRKKEPDREARAVYPPR